MNYMYLSFFYSTLFASVLCTCTFMHVHVHACTNVMIRVQYMYTSVICSKVYVPIISHACVIIHMFW